MLIFVWEVGAEMVKSYVIILSIMWICFTLFLFSPIALKMYEIDSIEFVKRIGGMLSLLLVSTFLVGLLVNEK